MELKIDLGINSYPVIIKNNALEDISKILPLSGKVLIISDDLIPEQYVSKVASTYSSSFIYRFKHGEDNKNSDTFLAILKFLSEKEFTRKDAIIALGGGVTSDLAGFIASSYMRGISFYIIPTTLLSQVDASIGGKVAINFNGIKNLVGAFYQPKKVIIDPTTLKTLDKRLLSEGLAEVIKMSMTSNKDLFTYIENNDAFSDLPYLIYETLKIKKEVVEKDEKENNIRQILNYGHTVGHALESLSRGMLYHGEAVAIGMTYFASIEVKERLIKVLKKYNLPYKDTYNIKDIVNKIKLDKKNNNDDSINIIYVPEVGKYEIRKINFLELEKIVGGNKDEK